MRQSTGVRPAMAMTAAERVGGFVVFRDEEGMRHAVRLGAVMAASDADCDHGATVVHLTGNRTVLVASDLDEVLGWFS